MSSQGKFNNSTSLENKHNDTEWQTILSTKENILYGTPPYMPILIENIPNYVSLDDFEFHRIKEVQTAGIVYGKNWHDALIYSCNTDNLVSIKLLFTCCKREALRKGGYKLGAKIPCKLFGRLINFEGVPQLEVHNFIKTDDLEGCLKTTTMLSQLVRQKYHYYTCSKNP